MNYELFKGVIAESIEGFLPPEFSDCEIKIEVVSKANKEREALMVSPKNKDDMFMVPVIYLDDVYAEYLDQKTKTQTNFDAIDFVLRRIAEFIGSQAKKIDFDMMDVIKNQRDKIITCLINTEMNQELLKKVPHREFHDLSIIYRVYLSEESSGENAYGTIIINNAILRELQMTEEALFNLAYENRRRLFPVQVYNVFSMYAVTCKDTVYGAASITYPETLKEIKKVIDGSFYLIPSSVHECMAVPAKCAKVHELLECLRTANQDAEIVSPGDVLGNNVYFCNGTDIITITEND